MHSGSFLRLCLKLRVMDRIGLFASEQGLQAWSMSNRGSFVLFWASLNLLHPYSWTIQRRRRKLIPNHIRDDPYYSRKFYHVPWHDAYLAGQFMKNFMWQNNLITKLTISCVQGCRLISKEWEEFFHISSNKGTQALCSKADISFTLWEESDDFIRSKSQVET